VAAGDADVALAGGMERMTNLPTDEVTEGLAIAADDLFEVRAGVTFPSAYALMATAYFDAYGGSREDLAHIASKNHANAVPNEYAQYRREVSVAEAMDAPRSRSRSTSTTPVRSPTGRARSCSSPRSTPRTTTLTPRSP